jgi:GNAT superfamily N-acetyltransferase
MDLQNSLKPLPSGIECRAARAEDYGAAAQLRQEMSVELGENFDAASSDWRAKFCAYFGGKQSSGNAQLFMAHDGREPIACAIVLLEDHYRRYVFGMPSAWVNCVYVRPAYRRQGIGEHLMQLVFSWARERQCIRVRLRTSEDGRFLYRKSGFHDGREMEIDLS